MFIVLERNTVLISILYVRDNVSTCVQGDTFRSEVTGNNDDYFNCSTIWNSRYTWVVRKPAATGEVSLLYVSLCEPLNFTGNPESSVELNPKECNGALVCQVSRFLSNKTYKAVVLVKHDESHQPLEMRGDYLFVTGGKCQVAPQKETLLLISFQCGTHLVSTPWTNEGSKQYALQHIRIK